MTLTEEEFRDLCDAANEVFLTPEMASDQIMLIAADFLYGQLLLLQQRKPDLKPDDVVAAFAKMLRASIDIIAKAKA
jgi:hypothetical protein